MIGTMSPDENESTPRRHRVGRLAGSADDRPDEVPITDAYDGERIYAYSTVGRKICVMREQPLACFEVDQVEGPSIWRCVIAEGAYEEVTDEAARKDAQARLAGHYGHVVPRSASAGDRIVDLRLRLAEKSGRFERQDA